MAVDPVGYIFGGTSGVPTYEELKRRRAIAVALASRQRGFPKTVGEGLTYLGESIGDTLADRRLTAMEREAGLAGAANLAALRGASGYEPGTAPASPAAPRPPTSPSVRPPVAPVSPRPAPAAPPASAAGPAPSISPQQFGPPVGELTPGYAQFDTPSGAGMTSGPPPSEFAMGGILNAAPLAAPNLEPAFPGEGGVPSQAAGILPSSGYLPPATAAAPPSPPPAPQATAPPAPVSAMDYASWPHGPIRRPTDTAVEESTTGPAALPATPAAPAAALGPQSSIQLTPQQRDVLARTIYGEASNQADVGQQAVANVILNRARLAGTTPDYEALKRNQFEPWWNAKARARMERLSTEDPAYQRAQAAIDAALAGDPTGGATHFYSPSVQAALGRRDPSWARGEPQMIGTHAFYRLPYGGQQPAPTEDGGGNIRLAAYAPDGGAGAPIPGMGGAGSPRLQPQIPPLQGPPPAPDEQVTPTNIEPMPSTAQFGGRERFVRTDAPVPGVAAAPSPQAPAVAPPPPQGPPPATYVGSTPSREPIPPAQPQTMEPPGVPPVRNYPGGRPLSARQQRAMQIMQNPMSDPATASAAEQIFKVEEEFRKRAETQDESDYAAARSQHFQKTHEFEKFQREEADRQLKQQAARTDLEKTRADLEEKYYNQGLPRVQAAEKARLEIEQKGQEVRAGKAPTHLTVNDQIVQWDQSSGTWKEVKPQALPSEGGPPTVKLTKEQSDELQHLTKVRIALDQYGRVRDADKILAEGLKDELAGKLPFFGNAALSEKYRVVRNAASNFLQGHLRSTSGAAIGAQEMATHYSSLVPLYGDDPVTIRNKAQQREGIAQGMYVGLGSARPLFDYTVAQRQKDDAVEQEKIRREMPTNPEVGKIYKNEKGRRRYWTGSRWEDD